MSLLVHELLIGTGGGGPGSKPTSNSVSLTPVSVNRSHSTVQVTHLQQRVVTINSNNSRVPINDKGSKLAEALAGIPPYSYSSSLPNHFVKSSPPQRAISHFINNVGASSSSRDRNQPVKTVSAAKTYVLPFVLQDHNYGAPPPPTPPHSPQPATISVPSANPTIPQINTNSFPHQSYRVHQVLPTSNMAFSSKVKIPQCTSDKVINFPKVYTKCTSDGELVNASVNNVGFVHVSTTSNGDTGTNNSPVIPHMVNMPTHQQQFIPTPKPIYPSPYIPPPQIMSDSMMTHMMGSSSLTAGHDTDDESRVSERSSSVGPSGEETETAPELEEEELIQTDDSITRCICNFTHDDGYMIQCDRCFVWQHVDCMEIDRNNIPDEYLCEACKPRLTDKNKARSLQVKRRQQIHAHLTRLSSSDSEDNVVSSKCIKTITKNSERKVLKKKKLKPVREVKPRRQSSSTSTGRNGNVTTISLSKFSVSSDDRDSKPNKRRRQSSSCSIVNQDPSSEVSSSNSLVTMEQIRAWIEKYEVAVTNHYSPDLRAKVHAARINGISPEFRESTQGAMLGHRCRVIPPYDEIDGPENKILVAATRLKAGTAIIEYQGKYVLKSQWGTVQTPPNLSYLPFVLQYNMQKEGLNLCVDARTYGNDARFARRSSDSNAEIRHVVERGSVHLYIVACKDIEEEEEITLSLNTAVCLKSVPAKMSVSGSYAQTNSNISKAEATTGKPKEESPKNNVPSLRKNGALPSKKNLRKTHLKLSFPQPLIRSSRRSTLTDVNNINESKSTPQCPTPSSPVKERRSSICSSYKSPPKSQKPSYKSPQKSCTSSEDLSSAESSHQDSMNEEHSDLHKMTREERKIAAYMKAFERMEKAAQKRQGSEKRKGEKSRKNSQCEDDSEDKICLPKEDKIERKGRRKCAKVSPRKQPVFDNYDEDKSEDSSEGERTKNFEGCAGYSSPPYSGIPVAGAFRFPKTKKALMNEWLNETVDPVLHTSASGTDGTSGVPTCYMRSPSTPMRKPSGPIPNPAEVDSRSAKKRWLRKAIIDGTEPQSLSGFFCSSPNSRPDSPTGVDYITPLKKRRLARESMSSEQSNTPPSTPYHNSFEEKYNEEMELDHSMDDSPDEEINVKKDIYCDNHEEDEDKKKVKHSFNISINMDEEDNNKLDIREKLEIDDDIKQENVFSENLNRSRSAKNRHLDKKLPNLSFHPKKCRKSEDGSDSQKKVTFKKEKVTKQSKKKKLKKSRKTASNINRCVSPTAGNEEEEKNDIVSKIKEEVVDECSSLKPETNLLNDGELSGVNNEIKPFIKSEVKSELPNKVEEVLTCTPLNEPSTATTNRVGDSVEVQTSITPNSEVEVNLNSFQEDNETKPQKGDLENDLPKPTCVKRKLSILEYRKRKSVSSEVDVRDECLTVKSSANSLIDSEETGAPSSLAGESKNLKTFSEESEIQQSEEPQHETVSPSVSSEGFPYPGEGKPFPPPPIMPLPDKDVLNDVGSKLAEMKSEKTIRWNDAPTLLEQQRENLTERLRKEFGLRVNGEKNKLRLGITEKWRNFGKRYSSISEDSSLGVTESSNNVNTDSQSCSPSQDDGTTDLPISPVSSPILNSEVNTELSAPPPASATVDSSELRVEVSAVSSTDSKSINELTDNKATTNSLSVNDNHSTAETNFSPSEQISFLPSKTGN